LTDILESAQARADSIKQEMQAEFYRFEIDTTVLTPQTIKVFEKKWLKQCRALDHKILAATLSPQSQHLVNDVQAVMQDLKETIDQYRQLLNDRFNTTG